MITKRINSGEEFPPDYFGQLHDDLASMQVTGDGRYLLVSHIGGRQQIRLNTGALPLGHGGGVGGGSGAVTLGVITSRPSGGYGAATYRVVTLNSDGSWSATGPEIACVIPKF